MKKTISTFLCIFLVTPFLSEAAPLGVKLPSNKVQTLRTAPTKPSAFPPYKIPTKIKIGDTVIAPDVAAMFPREVNRAFTSNTFSGKDAYTAVQYYEKMSAVSVRLQNRGFSAEKLAKMKKAFAAAAIQSAEWEPETKDKVVEIMDSMAKPGGFEQNKEQIANIEEECNLHGLAPTAFL